MREAAVFKHRNQWSTRHSDLVTGCMEVIVAELWVIGLSLRETVNRGKRLQKNRVKIVAVFSSCQATIQ